MPFSMAIFSIASTSNSSPNLAAWRDARRPICLVMLSVNASRCLSAVSSSSRVKPEPLVPDPPELPLLPSAPFLQLLLAIRVVRRRPLIPLGPLGAGCVKLRLLPAQLVHVPRVVGLTGLAVDQALRELIIVENLQR